MNDNFSRQFRNLELQIADLTEEIGSLKTELKELSNLFFNAQSIQGTTMQCSRISELLIERIAQDANYKLKNKIFEKRIEELVSNQIIPMEIVGSGFHNIRVLANKVRHYGEKATITIFDVETTLRILFRIIEWYYCEHKYGPRLPYINADKTEKTDLIEKVEGLGKSWQEKKHPYPEKSSPNIVIELEQMEYFPSLSENALYYLFLISLHHGHNWKFWYEKINGLTKISHLLIRVIDEGFMRPTYRAAYLLQLLPTETINKELELYYGTIDPPAYLNDIYEMIFKKKVFEHLKSELYSDRSQRDKLRILLREFKNIWGLK